MKCQFYTALLICSVMIYSNCYSQDSTVTFGELYAMSFTELLQLKISSATKKEESISNIPASVIIISRNEIEAYGYTSVEEVIANIPGYYMIDEYHWYGTTNFGVRGFFSDGYFKNVIVLVNGVPQMDLGQDSYDFNFPIESVDRIEVIRGPMSVIYGNGAFMGAINIITNGERKKSHYISGSVGSHNSQRLSFRSSAKQKDISFVFNGAWHKTDGIDIPYKDLSSAGAETVQQWGFTDTNATTNGRLGDELKYFSTYAQYKDLSFDISHSERIRGNMAVLPTPGEGSQGKVSTSRLSINYDNQLTKNINLGARVDYYERNLEVNYSVLKPYNYGPNSNTSNGYKLEITNSIKFPKNLESTIGIVRTGCMSFENPIDLPSFNLANFTTELVNPVISHSLFLNLDYQAHKKLQLIAGLRAEKQNLYTLRNINASTISVEEPTNYTITEVDYSVDDIYYIPRLAGIYSINDHHVIKMMYGKAIQRPSLNNNNATFFWTGLENPPQLKPSQIETYEVNYLATITKDLYINVSSFYNHLQDLIKQNYEYDDDGKVYPIISNKGEMSTIGAELTIKSIIARKLHLDISYTYQQTENHQEHFDGIAVGFSPEQLGYIKAYVELPKDITFGITGKYIDQMHSNWTFPIDGDLDNGERMANSINEYFVANINLSCNTIKDLFFFNLNVSNILDQEVRYPATSVNSSWGDKGTFGAGRSVLATIGLKL